MNPPDPSEIINAIDAFRCCTRNYCVSVERWRRYRRYEKEHVPIVQDRGSVSDFRDQLNWFDREIAARVAKRKRLVAEIEKAASAVNSLGWKVVNHLLMSCGTYGAVEKALRRFLLVVRRKQPSKALSFWEELELDLEGIGIRLLNEGSDRGHKQLPTAEDLSDGAKRILNVLADGKSYKGRVIADKAKLTYDSARKLLAQLKKNRHITHKSREGYRRASNVPARTEHVPEHRI